MLGSDKERPSLGTILMICLGIAFFFAVLFLALGNVEQVLPSTTGRR
jgi:hypothetical protein